jgi:uncharacterized repeat protein (TIGR02543 family)
VASGTIAADGSLVLKLYYDRNTFTVSFDTKGGSTVADTTGVRYKVKITAPSEPTKIGYTFSGWYKEADLTNAWIFETDTVTEGTTLYARWIINQYTITFDSMGGSEVAPITQDYGTMVSAPVAPTKTGYTFNGWTPALPGSMPAESKIHSAQWAIIQYTLTYHATANGAIEGTSPQTVNHGSDGTEVKAIPATGYHFVKWSDDVTTATRTDTSVTGDITVTATFALNEYTLTYTAGETLDLAGLIATLTYNDGSAVDVAYAQFGANGITVNPDQGTTMEVTIHNGQAIILTCINHTTTTGNLTVNAPSAPTIQSAAAGDTHVNITWSSVPGATGYKIYQSTVSGSYGTALTTVAESVYSYEITGLKNGVVYYFAIKATNAGGESPYSAEVTAIPVTVPGAPTNVAATAGNGQITVSFTPPADNGGSTITGYTVTSNPGNFTVASTGTTITVTGLSNGTAYTFTVTASNAAGAGPASEASNAATPYRRSNGGGTPSTPPEQPVDTGVDILVNGKSETAATATTTQEGDKTITAIVVDDKKVEKRLEQEGNNAVVTIPVMNGADVVIGTLNGQTVKNMESKDAVLEIKTGQVTYTLPASQINLDAVSGQIGKQVELKDIAVSVKISEPAEDTVKIALDTADKNNYQIIIKPIEFEITCSSGSKTVEVSKFSAYVERMIAIPDGVDPSKITTGVILNSDGTFSHVPTAITMIDGKYYAKINSLTNSTYLLIYSPKAFKDVEKHWAKKDVNDMASRLVVSGIGDDKFEPDRDITRAEFAAIVVRALGLMSPGSGKEAFIDVMKKSWYYDAVSIAYEYGIISGYGNGKFGPDDKITREQAMTMIARAMKITGSKVELADGEVDKLLTSFTDTNSAAEYAKASIASCVKAGIVSGRSGKLIAPKDNITRAEVAVIVQRLLRNSKLI